MADTPATEAENVTSDRTATCDGVRPAGHDGVRPAGHDGVRPAGHDGVRPEGHDGVRPEGHDGVRPAGHDGVRPAGHDGVWSEAHDGVRSAVRAYVSAVCAGDPEAVRAAFRPDAHMWGYLGRQLVSAPIEAFCQVVAAETGERAWTRTYTFVIRSIEVSGEVAVAVLDERGYQGEDFTNHFSLVREDGVWRIAGKTFFRRDAD
ncbi:nuclear transport factor 2 family protein [Streptomyces sp. NPDC015220]|uniref:nuclear transport factor 2 family protein n=1 Tax=Streptomyces sp. NPDC015220 TaxID=3364947 RepID=UPI0036F9A4A7